MDDRAGPDVDNSRPSAPLRPAVSTLGTWARALDTPEPRCHRDFAPCGRDWRRPEPGKDAGVTLDGQRLSGAMVKLIPAPFLGDVIKGASGETGATGAGQLSMAAEDRPIAALPRMFGLLFSLPAGPPR